jgi:hypothetical protein
MLRMPLTALAALLLLAGCQTVREVDEAMRRVDVLDRVFEPQRFRRPPPPPAPAVLEKDPAPEPVVEAVAEPVAAPLAEPLPPLPEPEPEPVRAAPPSTAEVLRRNPWMTRFWSELTPAQQARVGRRLPGDSAARWDGMGLPDRARLLGGSGA